jgi:hypothetical protein
MNIRAKVVFRIAKNAFGKSTFVSLSYVELDVKTTLAVRKNADSCLNTEKV